MNNYISKKAPMLMIFTEVNGIKIELWQGDIFEMQSDFIVNAANEDLSHGSGVAGLMREKAGEGLVQESNQWINSNGRIQDGSIAWTNSYNLTQFKAIIHAVGPRAPDNESNRSKMSNTIMNSFIKANEFGANSIVLPALSVGIFNYPKDIAAYIHISSAITYCCQIAPTLPIVNLQTIAFCLFEAEVTNVFYNTAISFFRNSGLSFTNYGLREAYKQCRNCLLPARVAFFQVFQCCSTVCDFCFYQSPTPVCPNCSTQGYLPQNYPQYDHYSPCRHCETFNMRGTVHNCWKA